MSVTSSPLAANVTLGSRFELYNSRTTGFDYMRIILALAVLVWHSYGLTYGREAINTFFETTWFEPLVRLILPMFFALSGFLVTASLYRANSLKVYLTFRCLRLFPALTVEVLLAAFILGPLLTILTWGQYFTDPLFFKYFLNIVGLVQYELPGLFADNIYPDVVNGSLWTVPYELECYIYLALFFVLGVYRNKWVLLGVFIALTVLSVSLGFYGAKGVVIVIKNLIVETRAGLEPNLQQATGDRVELARILVTSFFAGSVMYAWRMLIPFNTILAIVAAAICWVILDSPTLFLYAPIPVAYLTVWLGLQNPRPWKLLQTGDYSYGIYLYAFPIQQVVSYMGWAGDSYVLHVLCTTLIVAPFAAFSWHYIEAPTLKLKKHFLPKKPDAQHPGATPSG